MKITVKFYSYLRDQTGVKDKVEFNMKEGSTLSTLLHVLCMENKVQDSLLIRGEVLKPEISILVNGREMKFLEGWDTMLSDGDEISFFPMVAGGSIID